MPLGSKEKWMGGVGEPKAVQYVTMASIALTEKKRIGKKRDFTGTKNCRHERRR